MAKLTERMMFESTERRYQQKLDSIVHDLRSMADAIEREKVWDKPGISGVPRFANHATQVQHEVLWGLANLGLDNLTTNAAEADLHEAWAVTAEADPEGA